MKNKKRKEQDLLDRLLLSMNFPTRFKKSFLLVALIVSFVFGPVFASEQSVETYTIDPTHSWVGFSVGRFFSKVSGAFNRVKGTIVVDRENLTRSSVSAEIEVASLATNTSEPDADLRSEPYFSAAKFPQITFQSKEWKALGEDKYAVTGILTVKGRSKQVTLDVTSLGFGLGRKGVAISGWEISCQLDRRDFGIVADQGMIGNKVEIMINVRAEKRPALDQSR